MNTRKEVARIRSAYDKSVSNIHDTNLSPYEELALCILEQAVYDYMEWLEAKERGVVLRRDIDGISAKNFLESKKANYYANLPNELNIRAWVDEQIKIKNDIELNYNKLRKEHKRKISVFNGV